MNIFGLFFSFFIPGFIVGMMAMAAFGTKKRRGCSSSARQTKVNCGVYPATIIWRQAPKVKKGA